MAFKITIGIPEDDQIIRPNKNGSFWQRQFYEYLQKQKRKKIFTKNVEISETELKKAYDLWCKAPKN